MKTIITNKTIAKVCKYGARESCKRWFYTFVVDKRWCCGIFPVFTKMSKDYEQDLGQVPGKGTGPREKSGHGRSGCGRCSWSWWWHNQDTEIVSRVATHYILSLVLFQRALSQLCDVFFYVCLSVSYLYLFHFFYIKNNTRWWIFIKIWLVLCVVIFFILVHLIYKMRRNFINIKKIEIKINFFIHYYCWESLV